MIGFLCSTPVYKYKGWTFQYGSYGSCEPWPLKKDGELYKRAGKRFYDVFSEWWDLPEEEQEAYRVGGGCERF